MILGVGGLYGSGKGEVVEFLVSRGFTAFSLSDVIRAELAARGLDETRERMIETGNALRAAEGPAALARRLLGRLEPDRDYVIDSIRHPAEVEALRDASQPFRLLWVDADEALRLERIRSRGRNGDPESLEALRELEGRELGSTDPAAQQLLAVRELADETFANEGTLDALHECLHEVLRAHL